MATIGHARRRERAFRVYNVPRLTRTHAHTHAHTIAQSHARTIARTHTESPPSSSHNRTSLTLYMRSAHAPWAGHYFVVRCVRGRKHRRKLSRPTYLPLAARHPQFATSRQTYGRKTAYEEEVVLVKIQAYRFVPPR